MGAASRFGRGLVAVGMAALVAIPLAGCGSGEAAVPGYGGGPDEAAVAATLAKHAGREPGQLASVRSEPVVGRTGPGGAEFEVALRTEGDGTHLSREIGRRSFDLGARMERTDLRQYPCASCHQGTGFTPGTERDPGAHRDLVVQHPRETGATCQTCHAPEDVSLLALGTGPRATLDHAYRLCAQCHSPQVDAWAAGAHGKRIDGWQGRRVVMGCADCHDPHHPALEKRIPYDPPRIERRRARER
jgi:hypothetical protein